VRRSQRLPHTPLLPINHRCKVAGSFPLCHHSTTAFHPCKVHFRFPTTFLIPSSVSSALCNHSTTVFKACKVDLGFRRLSFCFSKEPGHRCPGFISLLREYQKFSILSSKAFCLSISLRRRSGSCQKYFT